MHRMPRRRLDRQQTHNILPSGAAHDRSPTEWMDVVRTIRLQLGESQEVFAERLAVTQTTVSRWETGMSLPLHGTQRTLQTLATWSSTTDVSALEGMISSVRHSPFPMILSDEHDMILAASESSGFAAGRTAESQTPAHERVNLRQFCDALQQWKFWDVSTRRWAFVYRDDTRTPRAMVTRVLLGRRVLALVQRLDAPLTQDAR